jgi:hypothetical protein
VKEDSYPSCSPIDILHFNWDIFLVSYSGFLFISVVLLSNSLSSPNTTVYKFKVCFEICLFSPTSWIQRRFWQVWLVACWWHSTFIDFDPCISSLIMAHGKAPQQARVHEDEELVEDNFTFTHQLSLKVDSHSSTLSFALETFGTTQKRSLDNSRTKWTSFVDRGRRCKQNWMQGSHLQSPQSRIRMEWNTTDQKSSAK